MYDIAWIAIQNRSVRIDPSLCGIPKLRRLSRHEIPEFLGLNSELTRQFRRLYRSVCKQRWHRGHIPCLPMPTLLHEFRTTCEQVKSEHSKNFCEVDYLLNVQEWDLAWEILQGYARILNPKSTEWIPRLSGNSPIYGLITCPGLPKNVMGGTAWFIRIGISTPVGLYMLGDVLTGNSSFTSAWLSILETGLGSDFGNYLFRQRCLL